MSTLIDFAADRRAPTPTAAAEMAVPVRMELLNQLRVADTRLSGAILRSVERTTHAVDGLCRGLPRPHQLLEAAASASRRAVRAAGRVFQGLDRSPWPSASTFRQRGFRFRSSGCSVILGGLSAEARVLRSTMEALLRDRSHRLARATDLLEGCSLRANPAPWLCARLWQRWPAGDLSRRDPSGRPAHSPL